MYEMMTPTADWIVVKLYDPEMAKTESGLFIVPKESNAETTELEMAIGEVIRTGPGRFAPKNGELIEMPTKVGEWVGFNKLAAFGSREAQASFVLIRSDDVFFTTDEAGAKELLGLQ